MKYWRKQKHWSQARLAEEAGISPNFISHIEQGIKNPSLESLYFLAKAFSIQPYQLLLTHPTDGLRPEDEKLIQKILVDKVMENMRTTFEEPEN